MFLSFELRQLTVDAASYPAPFAVMRNGQVFDASADLWDLGVDWGMPAREIRWRIPEALVITGSSADDREALRALEQDIGSWGTAFALNDRRYGWIQLAAPEPDDWRRLQQMLVPERAAWVTGGVASHPLLARWVTRAGAALRLPNWQANGFRCWVCPPEETGRGWATMPLSAVPASTADRRRWRQEGLRRVGEVDGLAFRLAGLPAGGARLNPVRVERAFAEPLRVGVPATLEQMTRRLAQLLQERRQAARRLALMWSAEEGAPVTRERRWPTGTADARILTARLWTLSQPWPPTPPVALAVEALETEAATPAQLTWWEAAGVRRPADQPRMALAASARETRFSFWDPWRRRRD